MLSMVLFSTLARKKNRWGCSINTAEYSNRIENIVSSAVVGNEKTPDLDKTPSPTSTIIPGPPKRTGLRWIWTPYASRSRAL